MNNRSEPDFHEAGLNLAVANTPLFVLRKLREDPAVQRIARTLEAAEIFSRLRTSLRIEAKSHTDAVRPYVYLIALAMKGDISYLRRAQGLPSKSHKWFQYLADVLLQQFIPNSQLNIFADPRLGGSIATFTDASSNEITFPKRSN